MRCVNLLLTLTDALNVPSTRLSTVGDSAFPVAAARVWNSLPATVTSSPSLLTFKRELFARSYPDCYLWLHLILVSFFFFPHRSHVSFSLFFFVRCPRSL